MICFGVIMLLVAIATVFGLLSYSARVDIDESENDKYENNKYENQD